MRVDTYDDWSNAGVCRSKSVTYGRFSFFAMLPFKRYLQEQADAGTPELDSDGKYMQLAPAYAGGLFPI